ncbi:MAG TPA: AmpG family muropeptide MFS transporter [Alphaproteobacteria bacterium]|jgi:PAT family beta-lactamase induction signal transducer AmpG|nr:AmpG family muropeptide MFS transporter [Alphaproteobacteria bacterium]
MAFPWRTAAEVYRDRRMLIILLLGFSSGLPLPLTIGTLSIWLATAGVSKTVIGLFAFVGIPYIFKFVWAPLIDGIRVPVLANWLGPRRAWAIVAQALLALAIVAFSLLDPTDRPVLLAAAALAVAFLSASQDIVVDAYRVEILDERSQGAGAAVVQLGYRIGMLASGAGALILADSIGWSSTFLVMAALVGVGALAILSGPEPKARPREDHAGGPAIQRLLAWAKDYVIGPFADFIRRHPYWLPIIVFIALYKVSDAMMGRMTGPFYLELGFSLDEIAAVSKVFGLIATIGGAMTGGIIVSRIGIARGLLVCGVLQMFSNFLFAGLALIGHDIRGLIVVIGLENFAEGMASAALVAYLSALCGQGFTATQYALLSSLAALPRIVLASQSGRLADYLDWVGFFIVVPLLAVPSLLILGWLMARDRAL